MSRKPRHRVPIPWAHNGGLSKPSGVPTVARVDGAEVLGLACHAAGPQKHSQHNDRPRGQPFCALRHRAPLTHPRRAWGAGETLLAGPASQSPPRAWQPVGPASPSWDGAVTAALDVVVRLAVACEG